MLNSLKEATLERVAYHEAGHAVASCVMRLRFSYVTVTSQDQLLGLCAIQSRYSGILSAAAEGYISSNGDRRIKRELVAVLAGPAAEQRMLGVELDFSGEQDFEDAKELADFLISSDEDLVAFLESSYSAAVALWDHPGNWAAVQTLAAELLANKRVGYRGVREIFARTRPAK